MFGRNWPEVKRVVKTRTLAQVRSHAQKVFAKMSDDEIEALGGSGDSELVLYDDESSVSSVGQ